MECSEDEPIRALSGHPVRGTGFTLVELLVSISIISLLAGILVPVLSRVRNKAFEIQSMNNLRLVGSNLSVYANDAQGFFPPSVATVGDRDNWTWYDPRRLVGSKQRTPRNRRSMSMYLQDYVNVESLHCPSAPDEYKYLKEMWEAGDEWDNPDTLQEKDPMSGSYCYFWGYDSVALMDQGKRLFKGPRRPADGRKYSTLLACDFFGYSGGYDPSPPRTYASCETMELGVERSTQYLAPYWSGVSEAAQKPIDDSYPDIEHLPKMRLKAVYSDGHVESYTEQDVVALDVISNRKTYETFGIDNSNTPGLFFIPRNAVR
jgi:prepilin-type N-terminal cleavage/methylation domain-containing protein